MGRLWPPFPSAGQRVCGRRPLRSALSLRGRERRDHRRPAPPGRSPAAVRVTARCAPRGGSFDHEPVHSAVGVAGSMFARVTQETLGKEVGPTSLALRRRTTSWDRNGSRPHRSDLRLGQTRRRSTGCGWARRSRMRGVALGPAPATAAHRAVHGVGSWQMPSHAFSRFLVARKLLSCCGARSYHRRPRRRFPHVFSACARLV